MDPVPGEDVRPVGSRGSCGTEEGPLWCRRRDPCGGEEGVLVVQKKGILVVQKKGVLVVQKIHVSYLNNTLKLK